MGDAHEGDGGAYACRHHDREHVNESGHGGLPVGVVPAAARARRGNGAGKTEGERTATPRVEVFIPGMRFAR
jgi:hypothetical protein